MVFCGVNYFQQEDLKGHRLFTGVSEEADVKDTLDLALRLHPDANHVYVVNEMSETGQTVHDEVATARALVRAGRRLHVSGRLQHARFAGRALRQLPAE